MTEEKTCNNCISLQLELIQCKAKNKELEDLNDALAKEIEGLIILNTSQSLSDSQNISPPNRTGAEGIENDLKRGIGAMMGEGKGLAQSQMEATKGEDMTGMDSGSGKWDNSYQIGVNLKKLQQELRVSKKAEQIAKDKLGQIKKQLERNEKDFIKYREDAENRVEGFKNEIQILQKYYDQLQNSVHEEHEKSSNAGGEKNSDLLKIIDDYSRQSEQKSKEIESLVQKIDAKKLKIDELKRSKNDFEQRVNKQKTALDSIKMFLRVLNSNFQKSINSLKQQNTLIREQSVLAQKTFFGELQTIKQNILVQINQTNKAQELKIKQLSQNEEEKLGHLKQKIIEEEEKYQLQMNLIKSEHEAALKKGKDEADLQCSKLSDQAQKYKDKLTQLKQTYEVKQKDQNSNKLTQVQKLEKKNSELVKNLELLKIKNESETQRIQTQLEDLKKESVKKDQLIVELKEKETQIRTKLEENDQRSREEIKHLLEKIENDKLSWYEKEVQVSGQREAERIKELREILENKVKDRDGEIQRLRDHIAKTEQEFQVQKDDLKKQLEQSMFEVKDLEKDALREKEQQKLVVAAFEKQIKEREKKIKEQGTKIETLSKSCSDLDEERRILGKQIQKYMSEIEDFKFKMNDKEAQEVRALEKEIGLNERVEELELQLVMLKGEGINMQEEHHRTVTLLKAQAESSNSDFMQKINGKEEIIKELKVENKKLIDEVVQINKEKSLLENELSSIKNIKKESISCQSEMSSLHKDCQTDFIPTFQTLEKSSNQVEEEQANPTPDQVRLDDRIEEDSALPPSSESVKNSHIGQEEDSFTPIQLNEELEKRVVVREQSVDLAMRGPNPSMANRPPAPRGMMMNRNQRPQMPMGRAGPPSAIVRPRPQFEQIQPQIRPPANQESSNDSLQQFQDSIISSNQQTNTQLENRILPQDPIESNQVPQVQPTMITARPPLVQTGGAPPLQQTNQTHLQKPAEIQEKEEAKHSSLAEKEKKEDQIEAKPAQEESKSSNILQTKEPNPQQALFDFRNNRFFGMINGFLGILTRRRQAYTGKPSSAMFYDEKKGRYIISGEEEEDDDVPPPPPPKALTTSALNQSQETIRPQGTEETKQPSQPASIGGDQMGKVAFGGALSNRNRPRPAMGANRYASVINSTQLQPQAFIPPPIEEPKPQQLASIEEEQKEEEPVKQMNTQPVEDAPIEQVEVSQLYRTTLDISQDMIQLQNQSVILNSTQVQQAIDEREEIWNDKFKEQTQKIGDMREKIFRLENELILSREDNEQTIMNFEILCQDLKFRGMDEVEDLQCDISILKEHLKVMAHDKAIADIKLQQYGDNMKYYDEENKELREQLREAKLNMIQQEIDQELLLLEKLDQAKSSSLTQMEESQWGSQAQFLDLQVENDSLAWQKSILEAEKVQQVLDLKAQASQFDKLKLQLQQQSQENSRLNEDIKRLQVEINQQNDEIIKNSEKERENLREWIQKFQAENQRVNEVQKEKVVDYEQRIKRMEEEKKRQEYEFARILKEKDLSFEELRGTMEKQSASRQEQVNGQIGALEKQVVGLKEKLQQAQAQIQQSVALARDLEIERLQKETQSKVEVVLKSKETEVHELQEIVRDKLSLIENFENKNEEMNQEISNMNLLKHKLNEHIIYLQNEIRKRDELLEQQNSDFGESFEMVEYEGSVPEGEDQFDLDSQFAGASNQNLNRMMKEEESMRGGTQSQREQKLESHRGEDEMGGMMSPEAHLKDSQRIKRKTEKRKTKSSILQGQLDEARATLKQQIEDKLRLEYKVTSLEMQEAKLAESIADILSILEQYSGQEQMSEQSSSLMTEANSQIKGTDKSKEVNLDSQVHSVIGRVFQLQRNYEGELSEMRHKVEMMRMQIEESESLKFDLEIMNEEKLMLEGENNEKQVLIRELEQRLDDGRTNKEQVARVEIEMNRKIAEVEFQYKQDLQMKQEEGERLVIEERDRYEKLISTIKDEFKRKVKDKYKRKYEQLQAETNIIRAEINQKVQLLDEQKNITDSLNEQLQSLVQEKEREQEEVKRLSNLLSISDIQVQEQQNNILAIERQKQQEIATLKQDLLRSEKENEVNKKHIEEQSTKFNKDVEEFMKRFQKMKQRLDKKKMVNKKLKEALIEMQGTVKNGQEVDELKEQFIQEIRIISDAKNVLERDLTQRIEALEQEKLDLQQVCDKKEIEFEQTQEELNRKNLEQMSQHEELLRRQFNEELQRVSASSVQKDQVEFEEEKKKIIQEFTEREELFMKSTKELAMKKDKRINEGKEKMKQLLKEYEALFKEKQRLEEQFNEQKLQKGTNDQVDKNNLVEKETELNEVSEKLASKEKEIETKNSQLISLRVELEKERQEKDHMVEDIKKIIQILDSAQDLASWKEITSKLLELLQNYDEDRRSLQQLLQEKENQSEELSRMQSERSYILAENSKLQEKLDVSVTQKLEKKVNVLQEERNEMRNDFQIKINSFVDEIRDLKFRLSRYEEDEDESEEMKQQQYSFIKEQSTIHKVPKEPVDQAKEEDKKGQMTASQIMMEEKKSGIFNSIASFFLTDSELDNN